MQKHKKRIIMRPRNLIIAITIATSCLMACEKARPADQTDPIIEPEPGKSYSLTKEQEGMVSEGNSFAFNLLDAIYNNEKWSGKDFMVSPLSISFVLGALDNGATGQTSEEILNALGFEGCTIEDINEYCRYFLQGCQNVDELVDVRIANAVMANERFELKDSFSEALTTYYDAYVRSMKFDDVALEAINSWCNENTEGMIPKILDEIDPTACLYAINSIYFKGAWAAKFDKANTKKADFTNIDGTSGKVQMMHMEDYFQYSSNELWSTVRLAYGNASYNMYVLLPNEGVKIEEVIDAVDSRSWEYAKIRMNQRKVDLKLPAFETETDMNLKGIMNSLGIRRAFDPDNAEFNEMITNPNGNVYLGLLKQKSKIIVSEEGTEAAAVTIGGTFTTSLPQPSEPVTFHADRPFIYLIQEERSKAIFFIGAKVRS